ncbi:MAG: hypothetical protein JWO58_2370 [Chitinophagaceae bacterium]|nr:hypothetical protein [Chitinophagaceae bacterium]
MNPFGIRISFAIDKRIILFVGVLSYHSVFAQISPPGLGNANTASWFAIGIRQRLDSANHKQMVTYIGTGRISDPDNYDPFKKAAILVLNKEFYNLFHKNWQYSVALSYRRQNEYAEDAPYEKQSTGYKQEFRLYGRYSYILRNKKLKWVNTFRQEFRKFDTDKFKDWDETYQLRSRFRTQLTWNIDKRKIHSLVTSAEVLFSISKELNNGWSDFDYRESRFCLYYSFAPSQSPLVFNVGYMNNLLGKYGALTDAHYMALDIIWNDPFGSLKRKKVIPDAIFN